MRPPPRAKLEYEKVAVDEWITGAIEEIEYDMEHKSTWQGKEKVGPAVKIKMVLDGYKFPKSSGWLTFNYSDKAKLYKTFIIGLVADPKPFMDFEMDSLKGMKIKVMYENNPKDPQYQNIVRVRPVGEKIEANAEPSSDAPEAEEVPF